MHVIAGLVGLISILAADVAPLAAEGAASGAPAASAAPPSSALKPIKLAAGTQMTVQLMDSLSSRTNRLGETFAMQLVEPVSVDGVVVIPAGATGGGEIIDSAKAGIGGLQGKLIISGRYLDLNGKRVRVRGMTLQASGKSRTDTAMGVMILVGLPGVFIEGGDLNMPVGTRATVRLAEDVELLPVPTPTETK
jgi:hypothetical protein